MQNINDCLHCLCNVRSALANNEVAYVARSRIGRLNLEIAKLVANICFIEFPDLPQNIEIPKNAPKHIRELATLCNEFLATSRLLTQPSEPLDDRWFRRKIEMLEQIDAMKQQLTKINMHIQ
ncbi:MAG: hypothetical protein OXE78_05890 [Gammaproteobacteria bacterium]|nr:hypothetical protein [Gammaproteobacteria bacterium]